MNVKHAAKLANLSLTNQEEEKYSNQLSKILEYIDQLNSVDTSKVESTFNVSGSLATLGTSNSIREDEPAVCLSQDEAVSNASQKRKGFFVTKGIFNNE